MNLRFLSCMTIGNRNTVCFSNYGCLTKSFGKTADCIACRQYEFVCPQHLPIIGLVKKVSWHFDPWA